MELPPKDHPLSTSSVDGRTTLRTKLYDDVAWTHFQTLDNARRIRMIDLSHPFVSNFPDGIHMVRTDAMTALIQELHHKLRPTEPAFAD